MTTPVTERGYAVPAALSPMLAVLDDEETPELQWPNSVYVYDRMRKQEASVVQVIKAVTYPLRRVQWRVDQAGAKTKITEQIAEDFGLPILGRKMKPTPRIRDRFSWHEHLYLACLQLVFGHAYFEQDYRILPTGPGGSLQARLHKLAYRPPKTIERFEVATDGGLNAIRQVSPGRGAGPRLTVDRLVAHVHEREGGNWMGQSVLRAAFGPWWLKQRAVRTWSASFDRNGLGVPVYTGSEQPEGLDADEVKRRQDKERDEGLKLATSLRAGENAGAYKPHSAGLELLGVTGRLPNIEAGVRYFDELIARAVLANFLTLGGDNSTGSYALGETFEDFFTMSLQTEATQIADVVTAHAVEDWVDENYGAAEPAPRIVFDEIGSKLTVEAITQLISVGAITKDKPLEAHLRTRGGLPPAEEATAQPPPPPQTGQTDPNQPKGEDPPSA